MLTIDPSILNFALLSNSKVDLKLALPVDKKGLNISLKDISKKGLAFVFERESFSAI